MWEKRVKGFKISETKTQKWMMYLENLILTSTHKGLNKKKKKD